MRYRNSLHCFTTLLRGNGVQVLYTGFGVNSVREAVFLGSYFYCYEGLRQSFIQNSISLAYAVPVAGGISGAIGWLSSFPLDCIRARVQGQDVNGNLQKRSSMEIAEYLIRRKGIVGFYSGVTPSIVRAFLVSASRFSAYEVAIRLITGKQYHHS